MNTYVFAYFPECKCSDVQPERRSVPRRCPIHGTRERVMQEVETDQPVECGPRTYEEVAR